MTDPEEVPQWKTGVLWAILGAFLTVGTLGAAFFVYGLLLAIGTGLSLVAVAALVGGGLVAFLSFLFMAGILYRVDRYRGAARRRVKFFE
ncbi:MAG: hypothetical protein WAN74_03835 [Thermoplasmata archaeon]